MNKYELKGFSLGNSFIKYGLVLSPMAGATDYAMREVCRRYGASLVVSEMVSAKALCYEQRCKKTNGELSKTAPLAAVREEELPMSIQIFGSEPDFMAEAAALLECGEYFGSKSTAKPTAIDINMGCPVAKVVSNGEGSALMRNPQLAGRIIRAVSDRVNIPVTVKIRAGWDKNSINAVEIAKIAEQNGAAMVCVHARTREQFYEPGVDWDIIAKVKKAVGIPVVGNGDVTDAQSAQKLIEESGCDGIAIGRGALGNPFIFSEIIAYAEGKGEEYVKPDIEERLRVALLQTERMCQLKGEYVAVREARKHVSWYITGIKGAAEARHRINSVESIEEIRAIAEEIVSHQKN